MVNKYAAIVYISLNASMTPKLLENVKKECIVRWSVVKMCGGERRL